MTRLFSFAHHSHIISPFSKSDSLLLFCIGFCHSHDCHPRLPSKLVAITLFPSSIDPIHRPSSQARCHSVRYLTPVVEPHNSHTYPIPGALGHSQGCVKCAYSPRHHQPVSSLSLLERYFGPCTFEHQYFRSIECFKTPMLPQTPSPCLGYFDGCPFAT